MPDPTPPSTPDDADAAVLSIQDQLDALLAKVEVDHAEQGNPADSASSAEAQAMMPAPPPPPAPADDLAEITAALDATEPDQPATPPPSAPASAMPDAAGSSASDDAALPAIDQEINALLQSMDGPEESTEDDADGPIATDAAVLSDSAPTPSAQEPVEEPGASSLEDEIAALLAQSEVDPEVEAAAAKIAERDAEQAEIEAAMFQRPAPRPAATEPASEPAMEAADTAGDTEDLIAAEIDGLLDSEAELEATAPDQIEPDTAGADADPSISEIDRMLADEAEQDEDLIGDFQSVQDIAAGIVPDGPAQKLSDHLPTDADGSADAVASEIDDQPELNPQPDTFEPQPQGQSETALRDRITGMPWRAIGHRIERIALGVCGLINWPVRRLLAPEWRSYVGVIALLNIFIGVAVFVVGVMRVAL